MSVHLDLDPHPERLMRHRCPFCHSEETTLFPVNKGRYRVGRLACYAAGPMATTNAQAIRQWNQACTEPGCRE